MEIQTQLQIYRNNNQKKCDCNIQQTQDQICKLCGLVTSLFEIDNYDFNYISKSQVYTSEQEQIQERRAQTIRKILNTFLNQINLPSYDQSNIIKLINVYFNAYHKCKNLKTLSSACFYYFIDKNDLKNDIKDIFNLHVFLKKNEIKIGNFMKYLHRLKNIFVDNEDNKTKNQKKYLEISQKIYMKIENYLIQVKNQFFNDLYKPGLQSNMLGQQLKELNGNFNNQLKSNFNTLLNTVYNLESIQFAKQGKQFRNFLGALSFVICQAMEISIKKNEFYELLQISQSTADRLIKLIIDILDQEETNNLPFQILEYLQKLNQTKDEKNMKKQQSIFVSKSILAEDDSTQLSKDSL